MAVFFGERATRAGCGARAVAVCLMALGLCASGCARTPVRDQARHSTESAQTAPLTPQAVPIGAITEGTAWAPPPDYLGCFDGKACPEDFTCVSGLCVDAAQGSVATEVPCDAMQPCPAGFKCRRKRCISPVVECLDEENCMWQLECTSGRCPDVSPSPSPATAGDDLAESWP